MASTEYVVDTHSLYWYLLDDNRIGKEAKQVFDKAASGQVKLFIPSIVLAELYWILEKQAKSDVFPQLFDAIETAEQFEFIDFKAIDVLDFGGLAEIGEMHDRMIVAVAKKLNAPCLTKDKMITESGLIETVW